MHGKWLAGPKNNSFSTTEFMLWRNAGTSAYQFEDTMLKKRQNMVYICCGCVKL